MESKAFYKYYWSVALVLACIAAVPVGNFAIMVCNYFRWYPVRLLMEYSAFAVIPFMAVTVAILIGFLLTPLFRNMTPRKKHIFTSAVATLIFFVLELQAEMLASRLDVMGEIRLSRAPRFYTKAVLSGWSDLPISIRIHYYIFSIILILAVLNWLCNLTETLYGNGKPGKRFVIIQGGVTVCYVLAYIFVRVMQYDNYAAMRLTRESVLNAAVCFILAALVVGFSIGSANRSKIAPPLISIATVLALYGAEYALLDGDFYSYGENTVITILLHILIIIIPGILIYLLLKAIMKNK